MRGFLLAYDGDCGLCTRFRRLIELLDVRKKIGWVSLSEADELGLLEAVPASLRSRSFHLISSEGDVFSGARALPVLFGELPGGRATSCMVVSTPGVTSCINFVYSVLVRVHDAGSCRPALLEEASGCLNEPSGQVASQETALLYGSSP